jgi:uncharacterized protein YciI
MTVFAVEYRYESGADERIAEVRPAHREWLRGLAAEGTVLASGPLADGSSALIVFRAEDLTSLDELLAQDPIAGLVAERTATAWNPLIGLLAEAAAA